MSPRTRLSLAGIGLAVGVSHVGFLLRDGGLPRDLSRAWTRLPVAWHGLETADPRVLAMLVEVGGWPQLLRAAWMQLVGRSGLAFQLCDVPAVVALVVLVGLVAGAVAPEERRDAAAVCGALLAAGAPLLVLSARLTWLHVPEAAVVLGAALPWLRDPRVERGLGWMVGLGAAALLLRPSALPWLGLLGLAVVVGRGGDRPGARRVAALALGWGLAAIPALLGLRSYLAAKGEARARYADVVPSLVETLLSGMDLSTAVVLGGAVSGLVFAVRARGLLAAWVAAAVVLAAGSAAGIDNFLVGLAALVALAGVGLARLRVGGPVLAGLVGAALHLAPLVGPGPHAAALGLPAADDPGGTVWPLQGWGEPEVHALLDATCPPEACVLGVDRGVVLPSTEAPGWLEVFLLGRDTVMLRSTLHPRQAVKAAPVDALVVLQCPADDALFRARFPQTSRALDAWVRGRQLRAVWTTQTRGGCTVAWMTPEGAVRDPAAMPPPGADPAAFERVVPMSPGPPPR